MGTWKQWSRRALQCLPHLEGDFGADGGDENADLVPLVIYLVRAPAEIGKQREKRRQSTTNVAVGGKTEIASVHTNLSSVSSTCRSSTTNGYATDTGGCKSKILTIVTRGVQLASDELM